MHSSIVHIASLVSFAPALPHVFHLKCIVTAGCLPVHLSISGDDLVQVEEDEEAEPPLKPSPDADTHILFVRPTSTGKSVILHVYFS